MLPRDSGFSRTALTQHGTAVLPIALTNIASVSSVRSVVNFSCQHNAANQRTQRTEEEDEDEETLVDAQGFSFEGNLGLSIGEVSSGECVDGVQLSRGEKISGGSKDILVAFANDL